MKRYHVDIRQWHRRSVGGMYISVKVTDMYTGEGYTSRPQYGHGDAMGRQIASGLVGEIVTRENSCYSVADVATRKGLHNEGEASRGN